MKHFDGSSRESATSALNSAIAWARPPVPGIAVAALSDDGQLNEAVLRGGLSSSEYDKGAAIPDPKERRHYMFRRSFQRAFVRTVLSWQGAVDALDIEHRLDTQPRCLQVPDLHLSFSASSFTAVACASLTRNVGIDVERVREIENVETLARRFFTKAEADMITALQPADQNLAFLRIWTTKEAGLKAIGRGIDSGLNSLIVASNGCSYHTDIVNEFNMTAPWSWIHLAFIPQHVVTVVHSPEK
jgi:phosphopantetheinyl transferase